MVKEQKAVPMRVIFVGMIALANGKLGFGLLPETVVFDRSSADSARGAASAFTLKTGRQKPRIVGGIYNIEGVVEDERLIRIVGDLQFSGDHADPKLRAALDAIDDSIRVTERARKLEATEAKKDTLKIFLQPMRLRYLSTDRIGRLALEVVLLDALRRN